MTDLDVTIASPEQLAVLAEQEAAELRAKLEHIARNNARLARAVLAARPVAMPEPIDLSPIQKAAERATGMTWSQLQERAAATPAERREPAEPSVEAWRAAARRRILAAVPLLPDGKSPLELHAQNIADAEPVECDALVAVRQFLEDDALGVLVLSGGVGTLKTGSACWMLAQQGGQYVDAEDLISIAVDDKPRYARLREARHVVIDDLGTEVRDSKGQWIRFFTRLWNAWYASCAKVVVTCNLSVEDFRAPVDAGGYGVRPYDRIRERGRWLTLAGASQRRRRTS